MNNKASAALETESSMVLSAVQRPHKCYRWFPIGISTGTNNQIGHPSLLTSPALLTEYRTVLWFHHDNKTAATFRNI